jgi:hypothetical protein
VNYILVLKRETVLNGEWHHLSAQFKVEKLDGAGDWIASDWRFFVDHVHGGVLV